MDCKWLKTTTKYNHKPEVTALISFSVKFLCISQLQSLFYQTTQ